MTTIVLFLGYREILTQETDLWDGINKRLEGMIVCRMNADIYVPIRHRRDETRFVLVVENDSEVAKDVVEKLRELGLDNVRAIADLSN